MDVRSIDCANALVRLHPLGRVDPSELAGDVAHTLVSDGFVVRMADDRLVLPCTHTEGAGTSIASEDDGRLDYIELCVGRLDRAAAAQLGRTYAHAYDDHLIRLGPWHAKAVIVATAVLGDPSLGSVFQAGMMALPAVFPRVERRFGFQWDTDETQFVFNIQVEREHVCRAADSIEFLFDCRTDLIENAIPSFLVWIDQVLDLEWPEAVGTTEHVIEAPLEV